MKTVKYYILALIITTIIGCKNKETKSEEAKNVKEGFSVEFTVNADKTDDFAVYWTEDNTNDFEPVKAAWKGVIGGIDNEIVKVDLPPQIVPTNIRVDFGIKPERKDVTLKNLKIDYYGKFFQIQGSDFFKYFVVNPIFPYKIDNATGTVTFIKNPESKQGTYFYPTWELITEIKKITAN